MCCKTETLLFHFFIAIQVADICIENQVFGVATQLASFFADQPFDGILGLAFQSIAVDNVIPPVQNMINSQLLAHPWFTVWMTSYKIILFPFVVRSIAECMMFTVRENQKVKMVVR